VRFCVARWSLECSVCSYIGWFHARTEGKKRFPNLWDPEVVADAQKSVY